MVDNDLDAFGSNGEEVGGGGRTTSSTSRPEQLAPRHNRDRPRRRRSSSRSGSDERSGRPGNRRIRNLGSPARRRVSEPEAEGVARHRRTVGHRRARRRLPRHDRYVIAIANGSADSQDVSSCRAEFNARMQAASVVLISGRCPRRSPAPPTTGDDRPAQRPVGRRNGAPASTVAAAKQAAADPVGFLADCRNQRP